MVGELEHGNIRVGDLDEAVRFLTTALPNFRVRGGGSSGDGSRWLHVGTDNTYVALTEATGDRRPSDGPGLNHLGFVVDDVDAVRERLAEAGYEQSSVGEPHRYRMRGYFFDRDGVEWEFVEYLTDDPAKRNDYSDT